MADIVAFQRTSEPDAAARLAAIVDSSFDAIVSKDLNSVVTSWNAAAEQLFGYSAQEMIGKSITLLIPAHLQSEEIEIISRIRRGERVETFETVRRRKDGTLINVSLTISPIKGPAGEIIGASKIARDVTAARENERRIRLLMREVNHRVKNQYAVILSMLRETSKKASDPKEFVLQVQERIMALARSHDLLVTSEWRGTSLFDVVAGHLKPFGHEGRINLAGPLLSLQPNAVQNLGMAFHELGTNSAKYGALSGEVGRVEVEWAVTADTEGQENLEIEWEETFAPHADDFRETSSRTGFGTVVLKRVAPQSLSGSATLERKPGHVRWRLVAPLASCVGEDLDGGINTNAA
jgi:PAS domain S-box-containing protein